MKNHQTTIALVDDHALLRKAVNYRLTGMGYNVVMEAENGQQFLDKLEQDESSSPDLCLLDINMPVMNGFETAAQLKKKWPGIKIIFFSMNDGNSFKNKALMDICVKMLLQKNLTGYCTPVWRQR